MLIVLVIIIGLAVLLASTMLNSANSAAAKVDEKTQGILSKSDSTYCTTDEDCPPGIQCDAQAHICRAQ